jgi:Cdc6-like AAA superfamily ATPase
VPDTSKQEMLDFQAGRVFTPAVPISEKELFSGRLDQLRRIFDAVNQLGQHAVIFGERGVGKTSLANIIGTILGGTRNTLAPRINCESSDDFGTLSKKILSQINLIQDRQKVGFQSGTQIKYVPATDAIKNVTLSSVVDLLGTLGTRQLVIIILDEFDRIKNRETRIAIADMIKALSDYSVPATLILVGVGETVDALIAEHRSIGRALVQVQMPRMSPQELNEILEKGGAKLEIPFSTESKKKISFLSQGLPHYTHLLGLHAVRNAIELGMDRVETVNVDNAIRKAVDNAQHSLQTGYRQAVSSSHQDSLHSQVLLACALAETDEFGYFAAIDVCPPMAAIMRKKYGIPSFARHLGSFCKNQRGSVLKKTGIKRRFRYRFTDPLMQPFVIMKGLADGKIDASVLDSVEQRSCDDEQVSNSARRPPTTSLPSNSQAARRSASSA